MDSLHTDELVDDLVNHVLAEALDDVLGDIRETDDVYHVTRDGTKHGDAELWPCTATLKLPAKSFSGESDRGRSPRRKHLNVSCQAAIERVHNGIHIVGSENFFNLPSLDFENNMEAIGWKDGQTISLMDFRLHKTAQRAKEKIGLRQPRSTLLLKLVVTELDLWRINQ